MMLSVQQVADKLSVNRITVVRQIKNGAIRAIKVGGQYRIPEDTFNQYLTASEVTPNVVQNFPVTKNN